MDNNSMNNGVMAVFAVSGSVVFIAMQAHKRLLSNFMKEMESQVHKHPTGGMTKNEKQRKVRFADEEVIGKAAGCCKHRDIKEENLEGVPKNWLVMYEGILQSRNLRGSHKF